MKILYSTIEKAVKADKLCRRGFYTISAVGKLGKAIEGIVNQGIDSRLEACFVPERGDRFAWEGRLVRRLECRVSAGSLPTLLRRLQEYADAGGLEGEETIVSDILGTIGIKNENGDDIEIVPDWEDKAAKNSGPR